MEEGRAAPPPAFLLIIDAENAIRTHQHLGIPFDPIAIRERASKVGAIAFAFALGNYEAIARETRDALGLAGFAVLHCQRLRDGNGGKDTVDEHLQDLVTRFLTHATLGGVMLMSDDRNFAPLLNNIRDRGLRAVRLTLRNGSSLDGIGETLLLPTPNDAAAPQANAPAARRWMPELIIEDLQTLPTLTLSEQTIALHRMRARAPFVFSFLRTYIRKYLGGLGRAPLSFLSLVDLMAMCVRPENQRDVGDDDLQSFLSTLINIGVIARLDAPQQDGATRRRYQPNWAHPFCTHATADIPSEKEGSAHRSIYAALQRMRDGQGERLPSRAMGPRGP